MFRISQIRTLSMRVKPHKDQDIFGTLSRSGKKVLATQVSENYVPDDPDGYDKEDYDLSPRKNIFYFKHEINRARRRDGLRLKHALEAFEEMKSRNKITPTYRDFHSLIYGCAKAGYTERAFELYDEYLKYEKAPSLSMITNLIDACAECPFKDYGLAKLKWLRDHLKIDINKKLNVVHYNCFIKAYSRLSDKEGVAGVIEEMIQQGIQPQADTFNKLMESCISDRSSGALLALRVYKRMKIYEFRPDIHTYKLLLRAIRDCELGSIELMKKTFAELPSMMPLDQKLKYNAKKNAKNNNFVWMPRIDELKNCIIADLDILKKDEQTSEDPELEDCKYLSNDPSDGKELHKSNAEIVVTPEDNVLAIRSEFDDLTEDSIDDEPPNFLSDDHLSLFWQVDSINVAMISKQFERIKLFGGMRGFLKKMREDGCEPDAKTFSMILGCIEPTEENMMEYLQLSDIYNIKRDLIFYDHLIGHICHRYHVKGRLNVALNILEKMQLEHRPNISTYENLAKGCDNIREANQLLKDLDDCDYVPSKRMIMNFFECAIKTDRFNYLNGLIRECIKRRLEPTKDLVEKLEKLRLKWYPVILKYETNRLKECDRPKWLNESSITNYDAFSKILPQWLSMVDLDNDDHPWKQFYVERKSKRRGFNEFVQKLSALNQAKEESLKEGGNLDNLMTKAEKIIECRKAERKKAKTMILDDIEE